MYPMYGDSAGYVTSNGAFPVPGFPQIAGVDPIPGYGDYRGDQGATLCVGATVVRRGTTYTGTFMVWPAGGGHGVGINNQILAYHLETGVFMDITQPSLPPMGIADSTFNTAFQAWEGGPKGATAVGTNADGRPLSTHQYNSIVYDKNRNRVVWTSGPAQVVGPVGNATYCIQLDGDGWTGTNDSVTFPARFHDYFNTSGGAFPNGRNSCQAYDSVADEIWNSFPNSGFANDVAVVRVPAAPGSAWHFVEVIAGNGNAQIAGAATVGFCMENEPWLVWFDEVRPWNCTILNRKYIAANRTADGTWEGVKRKFWNVTFTPKNGDPNNAIPTAPIDPAFAANVDNGIASTVVFDPIDRLFYAIIFCLDSTVRMDVYRITPPALDSSGSDGAGSTFVSGIGSGTEVVAQWTTEKLPLAVGSVLELPTRGNSTGGFYPSHKTASFVHTDTIKGIFFMHDPSQSPIFWKAP